MEYKDPGRYIPIVYLLYSWGSRFGVPIKVLLHMFGSYKGSPDGYFASAAAGLDPLGLN